MQGFEPLTSADRVHLAAAAVYARLGDGPRAEQHRRRVLEIQRKLANSLEQGDPLRASLLAPIKF
jgi:hypothetical protein